MTTDAETIFIDTNILLNFYHFTSDDLDALNGVFVSHAQGAVTVHLTDQVRDEFNRNREGKLRDALKQFGNFNHRLQWHVPQVIVHHVQRGQRYRLSGRIARKKRLDLGDHFVG